MLDDSSFNFYCEQYGNIFRHKEDLKDHILTVQFIFTVDNVGICSIIREGAENIETENIRN